MDRVLQDGVLAQGTSDNVDSCQTIESTHQLPVSLLTLNTTLLLQGLQQFFHRHCTEQNLKMGNGY